MANKSRQTINKAITQNNTHITAFEAKYGYTLGKALRSIFVKKVVSGKMSEEAFHRTAWINARMIKDITAGLSITDEMRKGYEIEFEGVR